MYVNTLLLQSSLTNFIYDKNLCWTGDSTHQIPALLIVGFPLMVE